MRGERSSYIRFENHAFWSVWPGEFIILRYDMGLHSPVSTMSSTTRTCLPSSASRSSPTICTLPKESRPSYDLTCDKKRYPAFAAFDNGGEFVRMASPTGCLEPCEITLNIRPLEVQRFVFTSNIIPGIPMYLYIYLQ